MTEKTLTPRFGCPLCRIYTTREILTQLYYEDALVIVVRCKTCKDSVMAVIKQHTGTPSVEDKALVLQRFKDVLRSYNIKGGQFTYDMQTIKDHWHIHYRKE